MKPDSKCKCQYMRSNLSQSWASSVFICAYPPPQRVRFTDCGAKAFPVLGSATSTEVVVSLICSYTLKNYENTTKFNCFICRVSSKSQVAQLQNYFSPQFCCVKFISDQYGCIWGLTVSTFITQTGLISLLIWG